MFVSEILLFQNMMQAFSSYVSEIPKKDADGGPET